MILVTGGTGFIGSQLVRRLADAREPVRVFGTFWHGVPGTLIGLGNDVEFSIGDLRDDSAVEKAMQSVKVVYHLAGIGSPSSPSHAHRDILDININGTRSVLSTAARAGVRRVVAVSSAAVYGDTPQSPKSEDLPPAPQSIYAVSKVATEHLCTMFHKRGDIETVILRPFNVYGPGQFLESQSDKLIPRITRALRRGEAITLRGDGKQTRDFIHVDDVVEGLVRASYVEAAAGLVINLGSGRPISVMRVVEILAAALGVTPQTVNEPLRDGEVLHATADVWRMQTILKIDQITDPDLGIPEAALQGKVADSVAAEHLALIEHERRSER